MKVIIAELYDDGRLSVKGGVDSAVLRCGEPLFIEEPVTQWRSVVAPAVRVGRLGTNISLENAPSYIDGIGAVHLLVPHEEGEVPAFFCDRAISPGAWLPAADFDLRSFAILSACVCPLPPAEPRAERYTSSFQLSDAPAILSRVSRKLTFKTGDIIILLHASIDLGNPEIDTSVEANVDGKPSLSIRCK